MRKASIDTTFASPRGLRRLLRRAGETSAPDAGWVGGLTEAGLAGPALGAFSSSSAGARLGRLRHARLELEPERNRRIGEAGDRIERHDQSLGLAGKVQADLERVLGDDEVPELVLEDDRHLVGEALPDRGRRDHARRLGLERDIEMVVADEPVARRVGKDLAHHGAQRVLHQKVVADEIGRHGE